MHLTEHISDVQLNEYLDHESTERALIESHLSSCDDCAARLSTLQALFIEIESLPELELTPSFAIRFTPTPDLIPQPPRWLTLTAILQAALAIIVLIFVAPFVTAFMPVVELPSFAGSWVQLQIQWSAMLQGFANYHLPPLPPLPVVEISSLVLAAALAGLSVLWLVGNGLLLRRQTR
jgi:anti-sigma factor RsiW